MVQMGKDLAPDRREMQRRNLIAGLLIATGLALAGSAFWTMQTQGSSPSAPLVQMLPSTDGGGALQPRKHQNPTRQLAPTAPGPNGVIATLTIPRLAIAGAPIFERGLDSKGGMLIAR